jgi:hypothetical protein
MRGSIYYWTSLHYQADVGLAASIIICQLATSISTENGDRREHGLYHRPADVPQTSVPCRTEGKAQCAFPTSPYSQPHSSRS